MSDSELGKYSIRTLLEQILEESDTFIGGSQEIEEVLPLFEDGKINVKQCNTVPALQKLLDEILVNCRDQKVRLDECISKKEANIMPVTEIKVDYDKDTQIYTVYNNGNGIDVAKHPTEKDKNGEYLWIPDMIMGHLLTSKNYNKSGKITGGKNGFGAKLVNIFSKWFMIETVDHVRGLKYTQEYSDNMSKKSEPKITKTKCKPYTKVSWKIDFDRFGINAYSDSLIQLAERRVYDIAGITDKTLNVSLNGKKLNIKSFDKYCSLYLEKDEKYIYEKINDRWEMVVSISKTDKLEHYSFVNGIFTSKGGKHIDVIVKQITGGISKILQKKHGLIPENYIRNYLKIFINSVIEDPSFESQCKERLITSPSKFGSKPELSDKLVKKIIDNSDIVEKVISFAEFKQAKQSKKTDGSKKLKIRDIPKLDDANYAGTKKSDKCTLILTEGDSAKSMAISGLSVIGRDYYGVFPLKGKVMNVKDTSLTQISNNDEITNLKKIIGLETNRKYMDTKSLRYGRIMVMTDQDQDGSHIKGLILNLFHTMWPSLIEMNYITSMITPIIKISKGKINHKFYNMTDYRNWSEKNTVSKWKVKYYKGLGTSNSQEAQEYFKELKMNNYIYTDNSNESMELAFQKDNADNRKDWLYKYDPEKILTENEKNIRIEDFIHKELIHFSNSDTLRSIGSVYDGLKPSQRKILYSCLKRNLYSEIKVAQLSGYVSENSSYHHGEASLQGAIIGMAQDFVGSNNLNILMPNGQFGTRIMGGKDSASSRYIHTELNKIIPYLFPTDDLPLLNYLEDDGLKIEPSYYIPIIPMVLINGMTGIGTGFSTSIPKYNISEVIKNIKCKLDGKEYYEMKPWYQGFKGEIIQLNPKKYLSKGSYKIVNGTIIVTELPIGTWTEDYKRFLEKFLVDPKEKEDKSRFILDYKNNSSEKDVHFEIKIEKNILNQCQWGEDPNKDDLEEKLKLTNTKGLSLTNIHLFNSKGSIQKFDSINDILDEFYNERFALYEKRKSYQLNSFNEALKLVNVKIRFIQDIIDDKLLIYKRKKDDIINQLKQMEYPCYDKVLIPLEKCKKINYDYLIKMPISSFTEEEIEKLMKESEQLNLKIQTLEQKTISEIWKSELNQLQNKLK
jgi:DNA topoisomerase-2